MRRKFEPLRASAYATQTALLMGTGVAWFPSRRDLPQPVSQNIRGERPRLAILPFENLSPDPAVAFFADGLHEEVLYSLAQRAPGLEVVSRTTMMTYRQKTRPLPEVARELGATHVIEGTVRREGDRVRLTLQLIDALHDRPLWSQAYDRKLVSAMTLELEVAQQVSSRLAITLSGEAGTPTTRDPRAYDLYLQARLARQSLTSIDSLGKWRAAEALLSRAIELDPSFALAYIERFNLRAHLFGHNFDSSEAQLQSMRADLDTAERLLPNAPVTLAAASKWAALSHQYARALALVSAAEAAGYADSYLLQEKADILGRMGLYAQALPLCERAVRLDPRNIGLLNYQGIVQSYNRQPREMAETYELMAARVPEAAPLAANLLSYTRFLFGGQVDGVAAMVQNLWGGSDFPTMIRLARETRARAAGGPAGPGEGMLSFRLLLPRHEYLNARDFAALLPERAPVGDVLLMNPAGVGEQPLSALAQGEANLLLSDRQAAAKNGRAVLQFVKDERETPYNSWFLKTLSAKGRLYMGDADGAIAAAREAIALTPPSVDTVHWVIAAISAAQIYAWAGREDEAVDLLERLSTSVPGMPPGEITRSPLYTVPLAGSAKYQVLTGKLEGQMQSAEL